MRYILTVLLAFIYINVLQAQTNSLANRDEPDKLIDYSVNFPKTVYIDTTYYKSLNHGFEFDWEKFGVDFGLAKAGNFLHAVFDYSAFPYRTRTWQRIAQTTIDAVIVVGLRLITGRWSASGMYVSDRLWCWNDEFYYILHGAEGNKKYANDFPAEHLWHQPIALLTGKPLTKAQYRWGLTISVFFDFGIEFLEQRLNYKNKKTKLPNSMYKYYY